ncbi:hypothetical protein S40293_07051 [Stachybotrys chartarum IBT 40293]|nr:hypothetical protein S40293_07051 [Stachybotrys chartarum IBT 40293]
MSYFLILLCATVAVIVFLLRPLLSSTRSIPGPLLTRWTDLWYLRSLARGDFEKTNARLHAKYGPVVRYGPNRFSLSDLDAVRVIYKHGTPFAKSSWYDSWTSPGSWSIFADRSIKRHGQNRRLYQSAYSMSNLLNYEHYVDECTDIFHQRLDEMSSSRNEVDMRHWFQCYAFDVISMITYARRMGFLDRGEDVEGIIHSLEDHLFYASCVGIYPSLHRFLYPLKNLQAGGRGSGRAHILTFSEKCITEHLIQREHNEAGVDDKKTSAEPFLSKFITRYLEEPKIFTRQHVLVGCAANMVAGSDTTAISLSAILYYLLMYPACLETLRIEIRKFTDEGHLSLKPTFKESSQMPYLQAVLKEALRLHPATGLPLERVVPDGGAVICGHHFPAGSIVGVNTWIAHRDRSVFGEDADTFRPGRWLESSSEHLELMNRHWMPVSQGAHLAAPSSQPLTSVLLNKFGLGSRTCIGRHISMLEISKLIPRIVRDFDFELADGKDAPENRWHTESYWFVKPTDFKVKISKLASSTKS